MKQPDVGECEGVAALPLLSAFNPVFEQKQEPQRGLSDAAHVMPPYAGEEANMAMLNALVLSKPLLSEKAPSAAIGAYEAEMFARRREMTADTMVNMEMFYAPDSTPAWSSRF